MNNIHRTKQAMRPLWMRTNSRRLCLFLQRRSVSSSTTPDWLKLERDLTQRRLPLIYDYLTPQPSHLLNLSLDEFLPEPQFPSSSSDRAAVPLPSILDRHYMPVGHHIVYFPAQIPCSQLLPDGTDALHSPGSPFNRRMWAGGSTRFYREAGPPLNGQRAVCVEGIRDMTVKGLEGDEKIFVGVERRVAAVDETESEEDIRRRVWAEREDEPGDALVVERRNLVFMRDKTPPQVQADKEKPVRIVKGPTNPEFSHTILPSRALLFRFSALTFNAHSIHLDRSYARDVEGYDDVLVHGPLTLTLTLTVMQRHLSKLGKNISGIEYRNLAPLIVEQPLRICAKPKDAGRGTSWEVWVERGDGGLAVRGTIETKDQ